MAEATEKAIARIELSGVRNDDIYKALDFLLTSGYYFEFRSWQKVIGA